MCALVEWFAMSGDANRSVNQSTIDSLKVFLQEMMATGHSLTMRHNNLAFSRADMHSLSHESPSYPHLTDSGKLNVFNNSVKPLSSPFPERCCYPGQPPHCQEIVVEKASVSSEGCNGYSHQDVFSAGDSATMNANPVICRGSNEGPNHGYFGKESQKHSMDGLSFQERQSFLEEIKKTVQAWSLKHKSLDEACQVVKVKGDQACQLVKKKGDIVDSQSGSTSVCGVAGPSQSGALSQKMPEILAGDARCVTLSFSNGPEEFKSPHEVVFDKSSSQEKRSLGTDDDLNSSFLEGYQVVSTSNDNIADLPSTSGCVGPMVESPDWLPHGWVTELKTRSGGRSAGCKYKCYFDPVSKRRFRTQKEVFCFLRTGNTGRYKPRFKVQQNEDSPRKETSCKRDFPNKFSNGHKRSYQTGLFPYSSTYNSSEGSVKQSVPVLHTLLQGHTSSGANDSNSRALNDICGHTGRAVHSGMVDIQDAARQLLAQDDDMTLDARARLFAGFLPSYGSTTPARNLKKTKAQGKERLEALGKVMCKQGLSKFRGCTNGRV